MEESKRNQDSSEMTLDIPPSLVSYFETSKSRAAAFEKQILEEPEDSNAGLMKLQTELNNGTGKSKKRITSETAEDKNDIDDDNPENENDFALNISDPHTERGETHCEQEQKKEQRQQREMDFQEELKRIMEAEKLHQMELELKQRNAQEKLEQELLLRQELIGNFKKQVKQERMMIEEEKRRRKLEEVKIKEKEEKKKKEEEDQRKRQEDKEENQKAIEVRLKKESECRMAEEMRKKEDERRKRKEEKNIREDEIRREREGMRRQVEEQEERKNKEEVKREDEKTKRENKKKRCFMVTEKMMKMDSEEKKKEEVKLKNQLKTMEERDDEENEYLRIGSLSKVRVNHEEMKKEEKEEEREEVQSERKTLEMEMQHKECEEKSKTDMNKCLLRKQEVQRRGKEMEGQKLETQNIEVRQKEEEVEQRNTEETKVRQERKGSKAFGGENKEIEDLEETEDEKRRQKEWKDLEEKEDNQIKDDGTNGAVDKMKAEKGEQIEMFEKGAEEDREGIAGENNAKKEVELNDSNDLKENKRENDRTGHCASLMSDPSISKVTTNLSICETTQHLRDKNISDTSAFQTVGQIDSESKHSTSSYSLPASLHEHTEQKRLSWMGCCMYWSELSHQNKMKQKGSFQSQRRPRRAAGVSRLAPLCPCILLESTGRKSLQEITTVTLEDSTACSLSTLAQCNRLQSLTLRRCGLRSLEGISQLQELCYVDLGENDISFLDCENMSSLRVLRLAHNKLTSIHGLRGTDSLDVLDLSHNSITRIAGLESLRRLQRLSVDHNQLISTKGLMDVYTLLHLDCSHNHLAKVEGLENSALLHTLDLRSNSLTEPPSLKNQVLLRELLLDDNSISSLQSLAACWLPLLQHLSVAQNRITQLPSMTDYVSLKTLHLRSNCLSELQNVCENLEGCLFLQEVHLTENPLQQERDWRSKLQKAVPGLQAIDSQKTASFLSSLASGQLCWAPDSFLMLCQVQIQQTQDLQQRLSRKLRNASSSLDAMKSCCHLFTMSLQLAEDQRFAHEYGDNAVSEEHMDVGQTIPEKTLDIDSKSLGMLTDSLKTESTIRRPFDNPSRDKNRHNYFHFENTPDEKSRQDTFGCVTTGQRSTTESNVARGLIHFLPSKGERTSTSLDMELDNLDRKNTAATMLQRMWRAYRQKRGHVEVSFIADSERESRGHAGKPLFELFNNNWSKASQDHAATVIQAFWRGCALRRRLASALAAFTHADTGDEDTFEEVDVEEFVVDEQALEEHWTMTFFKDSPPMHYPVTERHLSPKVLLQPKQAWLAEEQGDYVSTRHSAGVCSRSKSPTSTLVHSGLSERSEKILQEWGFNDSRTALLMLKRAQKMKATKRKQKKHGNPSVHAAFRDCNYQISPVEARNRPARHNRHCLKVGEAQFGLQPAEQMDQMRWQQAQQELQTQVALPDWHSESLRGHFLPEIKSSILSRGRVQLVADLAYADPPSTTGLSSNNSLTAQLGKVNTYSCRSNLTHTSKRVTSPVLKKEGISFRDNPVQLSSGWGGGKKRERLPR
ncbi:leucine-rich repeat and IQ domain-containing protein 1 isoform X2 [Girardinichthys multiradiatus]|nr:leucine-rich repeat and IQ domain-containing protein 1 isoform X2 [Girardinichthys multiradiatus]